MPFGSGEELAASTEGADDAVGAEVACRLLCINHAAAKGRCGVTPTRCIGIRWCDKRKTLWHFIKGDFSFTCSVMVS